MTVAILLLTTALVVAVALLAATAAGILAHIDGSTIPACLMRAATAFAAVLTLASVIAAAVTSRIC
ncbi:hypothetical protein [Streptomyces aureus]|uniref:hypothetical protein n=1 Tax=Streptomyces aureus TaxID=193461 RepID=UPI00056CB3DE|nr:hypothetical protein [Streptomyces aureus]